MPASVRNGGRPASTRATTAHWVEVNAKHTSPAFRAYIARGLEVLRTSKTPIGRATYRYIMSGKVKLDEMSDLTRADYERSIKNLANWGLTVTKDEYVKLHDPKSHVAKVVNANLRGYMWDDRIYLEAGLSPKALAATLVHEVNHVVNHSEEHYRGDTQALLQEFRAEFAERLFAGEKMTPAKGHALKLKIAKEYEFTGARLNEIPDIPPGVMIP